MQPNYQGAEFLEDNSPSGVHVLHNFLIIIINNNKVIVNNYLFIYLFIYLLIIINIL